MRKTAPLVIALVKVVTSTEVASEFEFVDICFSWRSDQ